MAGQAADLAGQAADLERTGGRFHRNPQVVMTQGAIVQTKFKFNNSRNGFEEVLQRARAEMSLFP